MLKEKLVRAVKEALAACRAEDRIPDVGVHVDLELHGDGYSTHLPVLLARRTENTSASAQTRAGVYAEQLADRINAHPDAPATATVERDGTLSLTPTLAAYVESLLTIARAGGAWGRSNTGKGKRALVEFVSANPNGPVTIQHARGASIGAAIAELLEWSGYTVEREFYVNDAASAAQVRGLARAVYLRYRERFGESSDGPGVSFDEDSLGEYVAEIAEKIARDSGDLYVGLSPEAAATALTPLVVAAMREFQEASLARFGVHFDRWFSEAALVNDGAVQKVMDTLLTSGNAYTSGGALWLKTSAFGDDGDRVLLRNDGTPSYFAGDLAYHADKLRTRAYDLAVDVWNLDHQPYIGRTRAGLAALGITQVADRLRIAVFGPVRTLQDGMELRTGRQATGLVTLDEILSAAGDATALRFALVAASPAQNAMDIDLGSLPGHGRLAPIRAALERTENLPAYSEGAVATDAITSLVENSYATSLLRLVDSFAEQVSEAALNVAPGEIARYGTDLAGAINGFDISTGGDASVLLLSAARQTLLNALTVLGVRP